MDELQISGKRYLSSRRVAKENGYHTDYIGQLIRGGKVKGQKVGRTWYVEADSFAAYLGKEGDASAAVEVVATPAMAAQSADAQEAPAAVLPIESQPQIEEQAVIPVEANPTPVAIHEVAPTPIASSKEEVAQPTEMPASTVSANQISIKVASAQQTMRVAAPAAPVIVRKVVPQSPIGLRYVADHEPLLPEIARNDNVSRKVVPTIERQEIKVEKHLEDTREVYEPRRKGRTAFALSVLAVVIFAGSAVVSSGLFQKINIEAGNPASVSYTMHW